MSGTSLPGKTVRAAVAARGGGVVASSRPCPVCGTPLTGRQASACSGRCRAAKSRRGRVEAQAERDLRVWELLAAAVRVLNRGRRDEGENGCVLTGLRVGLSTTAWALRGRGHERERRVELVKGMGVVD